MSTKQGGPRRVTVMHQGYGCGTGCCGHVIEVDGYQRGEFSFSHPYNEDFREWAEEWIANELGSDHVADLDWENCRVSDD